MSSKRYSELFINSSRLDFNAIDLILKDIFIFKPRFAKIKIKSLWNVDPTSQLFIEFQMKA